MSTSNNFSVICNEFQPSKVEHLICDVCRCHFKLHYNKHELPHNKVHYPPTNLPPPMPFPAQTPILQYEKVIHGESSERKALTPDQKCHLNTFGEKLGWTLNGCDEIKIDDFCVANGINHLTLRKWFKIHKPKSNPSV
ncbi:hypothetical protein POM88_011144 [Heracleum sosnowskyi]|uniref:Uncharacterized protein n=1 Tax=Heracleum sosnowskyi TaxID=360622 RepID=A0AAD8N261_9APIA|nr:hypothetical protein POM88_011144 [Heracleum sosnowskyi]